MQGDPQKQTYEAITDPPTYSFILSGVQRLVGNCGISFFVAGVLLVSFAIETNE